MRQLAVSEHRDAARKPHEGDVSENAFERGRGSREGVIVESEHEDPGVRTRRIRPEVAETTVKGDDESVLGGGGPAHRCVLYTEQILVGNGLDVVVPWCEHFDQRDVEVLVELDLHPATAGYSSRASSAPYAIAARMPSRVTEG
jgi:hypothetical protein